MLIDWLWFLLIVTTGIYCFQLLLFFIGLFRLKRGHNNHQYYVSVVVAARDEERGIGRCLSSLVAQSYPSDKYEIIVVDDHSTDRTAEIVESFSRRFDQVRLLRADSRPMNMTPKKHALDLGIINSKGEIICTTDADCEVRSTWISGLVDYFEPEVGMVVGFSQVGQKGETGSILEKLQALEFLGLMAAAAGTIGIGRPLSASGRNLAYRKQVFLEVEGFKRIGHRVSGDDVLLLQLIAKDTNWQIRFATSEGAFNTTRAEQSLRDLINQRRRWTSNVGCQLKFDPLFLLFLVATYVMNLLLLVAPVLALITSKGFLTPWACFGAKVLWDFLVMARGAQIFHRLDLVKYFPLLELWDIPFKVAVGSLGLVGKFSWKGRSYSQLGEVQLPNKGVVDS